MKCTKCHKIIPDNTAVCPHCHKVLSLVCPNCHSFSKNSVCERCGYIILEKCAKCGNPVHTTKDKCKCGLSVKASIASKECDSDEFAAITLNFGALSVIKNALASQDLYSKFLIKLRNLMQSQLKGIDGKIIAYGDSYTINFNKELSFPTSANKAVRLAIKILNAFSGLNLKLLKELCTPLKINLVIRRKKAGDLLIDKPLNSNIKPLSFKTSDNKHTRGMQIILDQYTQDCVCNDFLTDSLYLVEQDGYSVMFYELMLENYVLPPTQNSDAPIEINLKNQIKKTEQNPEDIYSFNVFNINAKCVFDKCPSDDLTNHLKIESKITALKGEKNLQINTNELVSFYQKKNLTPLYISCTKAGSLKPWGFFEKIIKEYFALSTANGLITEDSDTKRFNNIKDFLLGKIPKTLSPEDARFTYIDMFSSFLMSLKDCVIIVDGFEYIDDSSIQALKLYFDKFKNVKINFVFITNSEVSLHSKIESLLRTRIYTEYTMVKNDIATLLSTIKEDAVDFVNSFYFERIKENFNGSKIYFEHAVNYLIDKNVLTNFDNKLIIKNNNSVMLPKTLESLIKARLKFLDKNQDASMILAYSLFLGERLDFEMLELLGIDNIKENAELLEKSGFTFTKNSTIYINNYSLITPMLKSSLKKEVREYLAKNIIAKLGKVIDNTTLLSLMDEISLYKEEYLLLWKNSQTALSMGDYDVYLENCLAYLSLIEKIENNIPPEEIEKNKKDVYQNILMYLYNYSPAKTYPLANLLLVDAMDKNDDEKIVKLSNLMLQGGLIISDYKETLPLLHNILERMENPSLLLNGAVNVRFLLLSLVHIEILFNIGNFEDCIEIGDNILSVIKPEIIEKIKPSNFSTNLFVTHLMDTFRFVGFAKLIVQDDLNKFFENIKVALNEDLPEKDVLIALSEFLAGKDYIPSKVEEASPVSKIIFLILEELSRPKKDYNDFAVNIYHGKLLAEELCQKQLEYVCELLIAYAYAKSNVILKAEHILNDILKKAEKSAIYNIAMLANYLIVKTKLLSQDAESALMIINDVLDDIRKRDNQAKVFYAMFERLYIDVMMKYKKEPFDINLEQQKLLSVSENGSLERIVRTSEFVIQEKKEFIKENSKDDLAEYADNFDEDLSTETH